MFYRPPRIVLTGIHFGWTIRARHQEGPWVSEWLARNNLETNPITIKPETASHMAEQFSWVPLLCWSLPWHSFPVVSGFLNMCVSSDSSFPSVIQEPTLGPWKGSPFLPRFFFSLVMSCILLLQYNWKSISLPWVIKPNNRNSQICSQLIKSVAGLGSLALNVYCLKWELYCGGLSR